MPHYYPCSMSNSRRDPSPASKASDTSQGGDHTQCGALPLTGSCHCGRVRFTVTSAEPWPYQRCYCSICRKTGGGGGYLINLGGEAASLQVQGQEFVKVYRALLDPGKPESRSRHERHFCGECGSHLWAFNPDWPQLVHPVASAIDTPLPKPPARVHMMVGSKPSWVTVTPGSQDDVYDEYPVASLAEWHAAHGFQAKASSD